jgi:hypothetical protein
MQNNKLTTAPVEAAQSFSPEFIGVRDFCAAFGVGRSTLYHLLDEGAVRSISLRLKGRTRGKRLIDVQSVREYFARQPNGAHPAALAHARKARAAHRKT